MVISRAAPVYRQRGATSQPMCCSPSLCAHAALPGAPALLPASQQTKLLHQGIDANLLVGPAAGQQHAAPRVASGIACMPWHPSGQAADADTTPPLAHLARRAANMLHSHHAGVYKAILFIGARAC